MSDTTGKKRVSTIFLSPGSSRYCGGVNWLHKMAAYLHRNGFPAAVAVVGSCLGNIRDREDSIIHTLPLNPKLIEFDGTNLFVPEVLAHYGARMPAQYRYLVLRTPSLLNAPSDLLERYAKVLVFNKEGLNLAYKLGFESSKVVFTHDYPALSFFQNQPHEESPEKQKIVAIRVTGSGTPGHTLFSMVSPELQKMGWEVRVLGMLPDLEYLDLLHRAAIVVDVPYSEGSYLTLIEAAMLGCVTVGWKNEGADMSRWLPGSRFARFGLISDLYDTVLNTVKKYESGGFPGFRDIAADAVKQVRRKLDPSRAREIVVELVRQSELTSTQT